MSKVIFDPLAKLIIVLPAVTKLSVRTDVYSEWKQWVRTTGLQYLPALSSIGGEQIDASSYVGDTYFLENGWKIRPDERNHTLTIEGNIYTRDGSDVTVPTIGNYNVSIMFKVSQLVQTTNLSGGGLTTVDADAIAATVSSALLDKLVSGHTSPNTVGGLLSNINTASNTSAMNSQIVKDLLTEVHDMTSSLLKYSTNRTRVDSNQKTLTIFDNDGVTPIKTFSLRNMSGIPSVDEISERVPV